MKKDFLEIVATFFVYIGALMILAWAILKSLGIIHSPIWIEMIPYYGAGGAILGLAYNAGKVMNKIEKISSEIEKVDINTIPTTCPKCKSPFWKTPKKKKAK